MFQRISKTILLCWWLLPLHLLSAVILSVVLTQCLQGRKVAISQNGNNDLSPQFRLSQRNVVALISFVLTLIRAMAGAIVTLIGWRMAFYTLANSPTTLKNLDNMVSWRLPHRKDHIFLWFIFFFSLPAQFSAPILQGALSWIPDSEHVSRGLKSVTTAGQNAPSWGWHNEFSNSRFYEVMRAVGIASLATPEAFRSFNTSTSVPSLPSRLLVETLSSVPVGSKIMNISMPIFRMHSMDWATTVDDLGDDVDMLDAVINDYDLNALVYSGWMSGYNASNLFRIGTDEARLVLVNLEGWQQAPINNDTKLYKWPMPSVVNRTAWAIIGLDFHNDCRQTATLGDVGDIYKRSNTDEPPSCYAFARISYTAGIFSCQDCVIRADAVVEAATNITQGQQVQPHPLVETAISMIPELLFYTKIANSSIAPTWHNLNGYVHGTLATAYQAGWNSLVNAFGLQNPDPADASEVFTPVSVLRAELTPWRLWLWLGLNMLLTIAGLILTALQCWSSTDMVPEPALTALLLNPSGFFEAIETDNSSYTIGTGALSKADLTRPLISAKDANGRLHLSACSGWNGSAIDGSIKIRERRALSDRSNSSIYTEEYAQARLIR